MIIESLNIGKVRTVKWRGKDVKTGIYKEPTSEPLYLGFEDVKDDAVVDRKYHGGIDKACYAYSHEAYQFWKDQYPTHEFPLGFFGENLTIKGLNESDIHIGNQYKIGATAVIEVSQPREPCFKLGIRFGSQKILKTFINGEYPGIYFRVIQTGKVTVNDELKLIKEFKSEPTVLEVYKLLYGLETDKDLIKLSLDSEKLSEKAKSGIIKRFLL